MSSRIGLLLGCLIATVHALPAYACQDADVPAKDSRLAKYRNIYDKLHPWTPPTTQKAWVTERQRIRERLLVSNGLWPLPGKSNLEPQLGKVIQRDGYTVQHAMFASRPGHYVTGLIYRPANVTGKIPGILCPHGHWKNGRFYDAGEKKAAEQLSKNAESIPEAARSPLQARFVQLARMGCLVFHYDMVGYADSTAIDHRKQFNDAQALLWLNNKMGLQTWNSIRALDFVAGLPEVDSNRLAVTGASGGGTQSFVLAALDDRLAAAFPAVMVSTNMQGGCVCENASYMRIGINNVAIAALFAPKPLAMSGADDWTIDMETVGLPELRHVYSLYGKPSLVNAKVWPEFKHNYNSHARHMMYDWFNEHLNLNIDEEIKEGNFKPLSEEEFTVFSSLEKPSDIRDAVALRKSMQETAKQQFESLLEGPDPKATIARYREVVGAAVRVMFDVPEHGIGEINSTRIDSPNSMTVMAAERGLPNGGTRTYTYAYKGRGGKDRPIVEWFDGEGPEKLIQQAKFLELADDVSQYGVLLTRGYFGQGLSAEKLTEIRGPVDQNYAGLTYCYNLPLFAERVRDAAAGLRSVNHINATVSAVVGTGSAGPIALMGAAASGVDVERVIVDLDGFSFSKVTSTDSEMMLPGAMRYGDIGGLAALVLPAQLDLYGTRGIPKEALRALMRMGELTKSKITLHEERLTHAEVLKLLR